MGIVLDHFDISNKGLVVMIDERPSLKMDGKLLSKVMQSDGSITSYVADRAFIVTRNQPTALEYQCFLLHGGTANNIPIGSHMEIYLSND